MYRLQQHISIWGKINRPAIRRTVCRLQQINSRDRKLFMKHESNWGWLLENAEFESIIVSQTVSSSLCIVQYKRSADSTFYRTSLAWFPSQFQFPFFSPFSSFSFSSSDFDSQKSTAASDSLWDCWPIDSIFPDSSKMTTALASTPFESFLLDVVQPSWLLKP